MMELLGTVLEASAILFLLGFTFSLVTVAALIIWGRKNMTKDHIEPPETRTIDMNPPDGGE